MFNKVEEKTLQAGTRPEILRMLQAKREPLVTSLKIASDINVIKHTQGQVYVLDAMIGALEP